MFFSLGVLIETVLCKHEASALAAKLFIQTLLTIGKDPLLTLLPNFSVCQRHPATPWCGDWLTASLINPARRPNALVDHDCT
jgi:hypothetical protein